MIADAGIAIQGLMTWQSIVILMTGTVLGTVLALIPGIQTTNAMALLLPLTFTMDQTHAFVLLVTIMAGSGFAGAITAILINVPGEGISAATTLDGYPLARQGRAGEAIGAAAAASALGALFGLVLLALSLPFLRGMLLLVGPPHVFVLGVMGVVLVASITGRDDRLKALASAAVGFLLGAVGVSTVVGDTRFTWDFPYLVDGIPLIPVVIGLFAVPELFHLMRRNQSISAVGVTVQGGVMQGVKEVLRRPALLLRSAALGTGIGIMPGVGGAMASWAAYFDAYRRSQRRAKPGEPEFGTGNIEGVIAPEAANDSKEGGAMMPLLALGIPGGVATAILAGAFYVHGIQPGQRLFATQMPLVWSMIFAMVIANVGSSLIGLAGSNLLVRLTLIPLPTIAPLIIVFALVGGYIDSLSMFGVMLTLLFGFLGLAMVKYGYSRPPLLIALILFPIVERSFHISTQINRGSYTWLLTPVILTMLGVLGLLASLPAVWQRIRSRSAIRHSVLQPSTESAPRMDTLLALGLLIGTAIVMFEAAGYRPSARLFPLIVSFFLAGVCLLQLLRAVRGWRHEARHPHSDVDPTLYEGVGTIETEQNVRQGWAVASWIIAAGLGMWLFGIVGGAFLYVLAFKSFYVTPFHVRSLIKALVLAGSVAFILGYVFTDLLGVRLGPGVLM